MRTNRRSFLVATGLTALAASKAVGANDIIRLGVIGYGGRMHNILDSADKNGGFELVAGCDVYEPRRDEFRTRSADLASTRKISMRLQSPRPITGTFAWPAMP